MTDIYRLAQENIKKREKQLPVEEQAQKVYSDSLVKIQAIEWTEWYNAIKKYWQNQFSLALKELWSINAIDNPWRTTKLQERVDLSNSFLYYLSVFENNG